MAKLELEVPEQPEQRFGEGPSSVFAVSTTMTSTGSVNSFHDSFSGLSGGVLLLVLPSSAFEAIVPVLILLGVVLVILGPRISRRVTARAAARGGLPPHGDAWVWPAVAGTGVYGGYFGAAQGVLLMAVLGIGVDDTMQRHNATKNVLALIVNAVAALVFIAVADIDWTVAGLIALGSVVGGQIGATVGRRLPPALLRAVIAVVGLTALVVLLV